MELKPAIRAEFFIPGLTLLLSILLFSGSVGHRFGADPLDVMAAAASRPASGSIHTILLLVAVGASSYVAGVLVVMLTYDRVAKGSRPKIRLDQLKRLKALETELGESQLVRATSPEATVVAALFAEDTESPELGRLVDSLAVDRMSPYALREHEYRRGLRQIAAGSIPGVAVLASVGVASDWTPFGATGNAVWVARIAAAALGGATVWALRRTVVFQEQRRQLLLLHTAWLLQWKEEDLAPDEPIPALEQPRAEGVRGGKTGRSAAGPPLDPRRD